MSVWRSVDWQMAAFIGISLIQEYSCLRVPRIYYWRLTPPLDD